MAQAKRDFRAELAAVGAQDETEIDLLLAALLLGALDRKDVSEAGAQLSACLDQADRLTSTARMICGEEPNAESQALTLSAALNSRFGYTGDTQAYDDARNANLLDVMARKRGLPVALSILYISIARRLGWQADGLNVPAHFLIRIGGRGGVIQDPFGDGALVSPADLAERLRKATQRDARMAEADAPSGPLHVETLGNRAILIRLLNNIASRAEAAGELDRALTVVERMTLIAPGNGGLWWEQARLEQMLGRIGAAKSSLLKLRELVANPAAQEQIDDLLRSLGRALN
jgi:regulator of sirC expression with transglutaminase-like and TPR domain